MTARGWPCLLVLGACLDNDPVSDRDVIASFQATGDQAGWVANDAVKIAIEVCTKAGLELDPKLSATLVAPAGAWDDFDGNGQTIVVPFSQTCETRLWKPPTQTGTFQLKASIGMVTVTTNIELKPAPVLQVRLSRTGALDSAEASTLAITATLDVANAGSPSIGTPVSFEVIAPLGKAIFGAPEASIAMGNSADSALFVAKDVTQVMVRAVAKVPEQAPVASNVLTITE